MSIYAKKMSHRVRWLAKIKGIDHIYLEEISDNDGNVNKMSFKDREESFFAWNEQVIKVVDRIIYKFKFGNLLQSNNDVL